MSAPRSQPGRQSASRRNRPAIPDPRARILSAVIDAAVAGQLDRTSVADLCRSARIPERRAFYGWFSGKQEAFLAACLEIDEELRLRLQHAYSGAFALTPRGRARSCISALVRFVTEDPRRAEALVVHGHSAGPDFAIARERTIRWLVELSLHATQRLPEPAGGGRLVTEMALGGIHEILLSRLATGRAGTLLGEVDRMVDLLLQPYEGNAPAVQPGVPVHVVTDRAMVPESQVR